ncbi:MAG: tautomerase family protein [Thermococcus sp.]|nr:tautomerase family protein [Thermococcus sp.]RLF77292.1 MAG: hypothetical protein DRN51_00155 [Thermococci archaeon]MCD6143889.1 tautomerase family protein [Thermococcus sp.]RLF81965.1 MAG: hypothetical protein DRN38_01255 [Thermococci archaeon]RLF84944.1 MAG: hypothetical protein DRN48_04320 [Thermococci archaeon]
MVLEFYRVLLSFLIQGRNFSLPSAIAFSIGPRADVETKRELVKKITEVGREVCKVHHVSVIIHEVELENVGVDGELLADTIARRKG